MNMRTLSPEDYWRAVVSRKWLVISAVLVSLSIAGVICALMPKVYQSATKMWFEGAKIEESIVSGPNPGAAYAPTLEDRVMEVRQFVMGRKTLGQIAGEFGLFGYDKDRPDASQSENAIRAMRGSIKVEPTKDKLFITLSFSNEDPIIARDVTSRLSDLFIEETLKDRERGVEAAEDFLGLELKHAKAELEVKEKIISEFKQQHLGELPQQIDANLRKLDRLQDDMRSQSEQVQNLVNRLSQIDKNIKDYEETGEVSDSLTGGISKRNKDPRLGRIKELERRLVELSSMYKETYPDLVQVKEEIRKLKEMTSAQYRDLLPDSDGAEEPSGIRRSKRKALDPYHAELLKQREDILLELDSVKRHQAHISLEISQYERRVEHTPEREQKLKTLERDYENLQKNYQSLLDKKLSAGMQKSLAQGRKGAKFSIVDPAYTPVVPVVPNIPLIMMAGLALGCALGFGGAVGLELMGRGFRSAEEVEITLGLPVIASIPLYESAFGGTMQTVRALSTKNRTSTMLLPGHGRQGEDLHVTGGTPALRTGNRIPNGQLHHPTPGLELVSMWRPLSFVAEQYRVAATRLELMTGDRKSTAIVVTSAVMGEGKSSTALNLGYVLAKDLDRKTLVIDCDLKRPMQHIYSGVWQQPGLAEVLRGTKVVEDCLQRLGEVGPWILTAGAVGENPLALSKMHQLADLITDLKEKFDYVIIDAPPVLPLADMQVLASMADLLAYVVKASMTGRDVVQKALKVIGDTANVGIILNGLDAHTTPYYMQQEYYRETHHEQLK
ncbi:MAG: putative Lipopolysaccharide biosynthesis protein [Nitrospira sp.]|nr:putative Lipopolysaccharide biosynthesis protein [Nitrospira sp.]